jgi:hypothetical protein
MFLPSQSVGLRPLQTHRRLAGVLVGLLMTLAICIGSASVALAAPHRASTSKSVLPPINLCGAGTHVWGTPSVVSMPYSWLPEVYAFAEGSNYCNTHLYVAHFTGTAWRWEYPPDPSGASVNSFPASVVFNLGNGYQGAVYVIGSNGHLFELFWWQGQYQWGSWIDLTQQGDPLLQGNPAATFYAFGSTIYVVARGVDGHLYMWNSRNGWLQVGSPTDPTVTSDPTVFIYQFPDPTTYGVTQYKLYTFATGANGNIDIWKWIEGPYWDLAYYRPPTTTAVGRPFAYETPVDGVNYFDAFFRDANGHLEDLVWDEQYWRFVDMSTTYPGLPPGYTISCGAGGAAAPDNVTYTFYACGTDGSVASLVWNGSGWFWYDLGKPPTGMYIIYDAGVIAAWENDISTTNALVVGDDGRMYITDWAGTPWVNLGTP